MNGSSFPATMEREGGSGYGNKVTLASCRHCMAELSRTEILYAQGWGVVVYVCMQQAGSGRKQGRLKAIFSTPPSVFKECRMGPGGCSAGDHFAPAFFRLGA